jgi:hypothetical protein
MKIVVKKLFCTLVICAAAAVFAACGNPWMKAITAPLYEDKKTPESPAAPEETTVTGVTVTPGTANVGKGETLLFTATVTGTGSPAQTVTWTVEGGTGGSTIFSTGPNTANLTVDVAETATTLFVTATSTVDTAVSDTATVTVSDLPVTVDSVTVTPSSASVNKGETLLFTATVNGTGSPDQTVTWIVTGGTGGSTIFSTGPNTANLTVAATEITATTLTVTATSTADTSKSSTATVTVTNVLTSITNIADYLATAPGNPIPLEVDLDLASDWSALLTAVSIAPRPVALDLSACTISGMTATSGEFDPGTAGTGESQIVSLVLPDAATSIVDGSPGSPVFQFFTTLEEVSGKKVKTVGNYAFTGYDALQKVDFPEATGVGENAFSSCYGLQTALLPTVTDIGNYAFSGCTVLETVTLSKAETIGEGAFWGCANLTSISLPEATSIGNSAFRDCTSLETVDVSGAVSIGISAFFNCNDLDPINLPVAQTISASAFDGCYNLGSVSLPSAVTIGAGAFGHCDSVTEITLGAVPPTVGWALFEGTAPGTIIIHVPSGSVSDYTTWATANSGNFSSKGITIQALP